MTTDLVLTHLELLKEALPGVNAESVVITVSPVSIPAKARYQAKCQRRETRMGIVLVARLAISAVWPFGTRSISTGERITSATWSATRSRLPSAQRHSIAMV